MRVKYVLFSMMLITVLAGTSFSAVQQKKRRIPPKPVTSKTAPQPAPTIAVRVRFNSGQEVTGRLVDINLKNVIVDQGNGNTITVSMQEVASLTLGDTKAKLDPDFLKDADSAYRALLALSIATDGNVSYSEYQPKINDAKTAVEIFITKHERSGQTEIFRSMRSAVSSFEMVVPIWSLRIGQEQHKYVTDTTKQMQPILNMFPEIKQVAWKQNDRYPIEKVIAWVWIQAGRYVEQSKQQLGQIR